VSLEIVCEVCYWYAVASDRHASIAQQLNIGMGIVNLPKKEDLPTKRGREKQESDSNFVYIVFSSFNLAKIKQNRCSGHPNQQSKLFGCKKKISV
jgi:hypothetical protein